MIMNKILVIAVAAVVVTGGVGAAIFFMNQGKSSDDFSFKDCHFDLSGAKSLVIAKDSAVSSTSSMVSKNYGGDVGAASLSFADAANGYDYSLYKTNEYGNYIKVLLYGNDTTGSDGDAIDFKMIPVSMEISEDGKYILMGFAKPDDIRVMEEEKIVDARVTYVIVVASTGKVYRLNEQTVWVSVKNPTKSGLSDYYYGVDYSHPKYSIIGSFDSKIILRHGDRQDQAYYVAYVDNDELVMKEIMSKNVLSELTHEYKVFNNGIMMVRDNVDDYLVFPDGGLYKCNEDLIVYCNNLCSAITYYDDATKMFASSYTAIKSLNKLTNQLVTEKIDLTEAQSFELAKNNPCRSELYREITNTEITVYVMEDVGHLFKFKLKSDCTVDYTSGGLGRIALPSDMKLGKGTMSDIFTNSGSMTDRIDDPTLEGDYINGYTVGGFPTYLEDYLILRGHICEAIHSSSSFAIDGIMPYYFGDIAVSGSTLFKISNSSLKIYDLKTGTTTNYPIPNLTKVNSMEVINGKMIIEGVTNTGAIMKGSLDLNSGQFDTSYSNVLTEVRLVALN